MGGFAAAVAAPVVASLAGSLVSSFLAPDVPEPQAPSREPLQAAIPPDGPDQASVEAKAKKDIQVKSDSLRAFKRRSTASSSLFASGEESTVGGGAVKKTLLGG